VGRDYLTRCPPSGEDRGGSERARGGGPQVRPWACLMVISGRKAKKWVRGMPLALVYSCISFQVDNSKSMSVYVLTMGRVYKKIYVDDEIYRLFKQNVKPVKVSQALEVYMDIVNRAEGSKLQAYIEKMVEERFKIIPST